MQSELALKGGAPVRSVMLPYARQSINDDDIQAVVGVLRSSWLTTGPKVEEFEAAIADFVQSSYAVAVSSGTAALHTAMYAVGVQPGDEVIVPAITFAATANCVVFQGGMPVFVDVDPDTLLIDPEQVEAKITPRTKVIIAVDYAGQPCDYSRLRAIAERYGIVLVADACHSLGAKYRGSPVGSLADITVFSFHPVKPITTAEGGMVITNDPRFAERARRFRNHGITTDHRQREIQGSWFYEMVDLGYNYRLSDLQCALGLSQLSKLPQWLRRRREIAEYYAAALSHYAPYIKPLGVHDDVEHAWHLYVVRFNLSLFKVNRLKIFQAFRAEGIGVNVHYIPVYWHPFYRQKFGLSQGLCPVAEQAYQEILSLPLFPTMTPSDQEDVMKAVEKIVRAYS